MREAGGGAPASAARLSINTHFWDWICWLATKAAVGREDLIAEHWPQRHGHLLGPLGVETVPKDVEAAISVARRDELERHFPPVGAEGTGGTDPPGIRRVGATARQP